MSIMINGSVGRGGVNRKGDTRKIQKLLNAVFPGTPLDETGEVDAKTIRRIERFQRRFLNNPDGRVDPGGKTLRRLNQAAPGESGEWKGDSSKWSQEKKLRSLDPRMRPIVEHIIAELAHQGFKPKIFFAWRSVKVQQELKAQGNSTISFSFHNAQKPDGTPNAYAVDIIDRRWAWEKEAETNGFWEALGRLAKAEGLFWGGDWRKFKDVAHVQFHPNRMLAEIRRESNLA